MQIRRRLSFLLFVLIAADPVVINAAEQQKAGKPVLPSLSESMEISIINLDVVVTDRSGQRVRGLKQDDFEILENRKRQAISNFAEYSSEVEPGTVTVDAAQNVESAPRQQRTIVLFVEQQQLIDFEAKRMVDSMRDLLHGIIEPGDAVSVVLWARSNDVHLAYTDKPDEIEKDLQRVLSFTTRATHDPVRQLREDVVETRLFEAEVSAMAATAGIKNVTLDPETAGDAAATLQALTAMTEMKRRVNAINATINSMAGREGKKILILATRRLGEIAGGEFFYATGTHVLSPQVRQRYGTDDLMKSIVDNANASRVTIYPIHPSGLGDAMPDASITALQDPMLEVLTMTNEMISLTNIAQKTGGLVAGSVKEIVALMPRIEEDVTDYYSLAYRANADRNDRARDIVVRAKNPEYSVRSRRQYVEKTDTTRMKDRVVATLFRNFEDSAFAITAEFGAPRRQGRRDLFPMKIHIPIKNLTILPSGDTNAGAFSVFVATSIHVGRISDVTQQTQSFEIAQKDLERALAGHFTYNFDLVVDDKVDRVAIGVFDEVSKTYGLLRLPIPGRQMMISSAE